VGHLLEMLGQSSLGAHIDLVALPVLDGALRTLADGIVSTLQEKNAAFSRQIENDTGARQDPRYALLFDPQTSGGLLAGVAESRAEACIDALRALGYDHSAVIGTIVHADDAKRRIRVSEPS